MPPNYFLLDEFFLVGIHSSNLFTREMRWPGSHHMKSPRRFLVENLKLPPVGRKTINILTTVLASDFILKRVRLKTVEKGSYVTRGEGKKLLRDS